MRTGLGWAGRSEDVGVILGFDEGLLLEVEGRCVGSWGSERRRMMMRLRRGDVDDADDDDDNNRRYV